MTKPPLHRRALRPPHPAEAVLLFAASLLACERPSISAEPIASMTASAAPSNEVVVAPPASPLLYGREPDGTEWQVQPMAPQLYQTKDGGRTWRATRIETTIVPRYARLAFHGARVWLSFVGGDAAAVFRSDDRGQSWQKTADDALFLLGFVDDETGWAITAPAGPRAARVTQDAGRTWRSVDLPGDVQDLWPPAPSGLAAVTDKDGLACYATLDGGKTWTRTCRVALGSATVTGPHGLDVRRGDVMERSADDGRTWTALGRD
ncbi:MAG: hypothetical protein U0414_42855 [Polyangiaceae bacterium]